MARGAHAEYMCVPERFPITHMPASMSFEQAGAVGDGALLAHKRFGDKKVVFELPPRLRKEDMILLKGLIEAGEYRPVIDRPIRSTTSSRRTGTPTHTRKSGTSS